MILTKVVADYTPLQIKGDLNARKTTILNGAACE